LSIPGAPEKAFADYGGGDGGIGCGDAGVGDVGSIFVGEGGIGAFPGNDTSAKIAELDERFLDPSCSES
jgi:hypothetical protein